MTTKDYKLEITNEQLKINNEKEVPLYLIVIILFI